MDFGKTPTIPWISPEVYRGLRFRSLALLEEDTTYQVSVSGVEGLSGAAMEPHAWSFTAGSGATIQNTPVPEVTRYYHFGNQRVAMRQTGLDGQDVLYWLTGDHVRPAERPARRAWCWMPTAIGRPRLAITPYGEERWPDDDTVPTDYRFTGQKFRLSVHRSLLLPDRQIRQKCSGSGDPLRAIAVY